MHGTDSHFQGLASRALRLVEDSGRDFLEAAVRAVLEARELAELDQRESAVWLTIAEMLSGKYGEEVSHA